MPESMIYFPALIFSTETIFMSPIEQLYPRQIHAIKREHQTLGIRLETMTILNCMITGFFMYSISSDPDAVTLHALGHLYSQKRHG